MAISYRTIPSAPNCFAGTDGRIYKAHGRTREWGSPACQTVNGYLRCTIAGKKHLVHRLIAEAFLGPIPPDKEVNHINGSKTDNRPENLEYVTRKENVAHATRTGLRANVGGKTKFTPEQIAKIRELRKTTRVTDLAKAFNVSKGYMSHICKGTRPYKWLALPVGSYSQPATPSDAQV